MKRLSGLQNDVIHLYRHILRAIRTKPPESQAHFKQFARNGFDKYRNLSPREFSTIEYLLRQGKRSLEVYSQPGVRDIHI